MATKTENTNTDSQDGQWTTTHNRKTDIWGISQHFQIDFPALTVITSSCEYKNNSIVPNWRWHVVSCLEKQLKK